MTETKNVDNPLLFIRKYDPIDDYWLKFPHVERYNPSSYFDGLRHPDGYDPGYFANVFCGPHDECIIRYQDPAHYLEQFTGIRYEITPEPRHIRVKGPDGNKVNWDKEAWYRIDAPDRAKEISPKDHYAPLVAFSRQYLRTTKKLINEGLQRQQPEFKQRLENELRQFVEQLIGTSKED